MTNCNINFNFENEILRISISDEINHRNAAEMREEIDEKIRELTPKKAVLDFSQLNSIDSSGIGLILGRYELLKEFRAKLVIENPNMCIYKLLKLSKVDKIIRIENCQ